MEGRIKVPFKTHINTHKLTNTQVNFSLEGALNKEFLSVQLTSERT